MTEKRQTSQGYIILILQHFATKRRNITNFVMFFQAVMKVLSIDLSIDQNFTHKGKGLSKCLTMPYSICLTDFVSFFHAFILIAILPFYE